MTKEIPKLIYKTQYGMMYNGLAEDVLTSKYLQENKGKIQLIFTSPPFPLNKKKKYGNLQGAEYIEWLAGMANLFKEYLTEDGSIVIEIGKAWEQKKPTMTTIDLKALLEFQARGNLHLCQEFIAYNPARLPSPAQWVTVERIRVKDSFTRIWWLSPTYRPKADNTKILQEYSDSMKKLLEKRNYNSGKRPSEHKIGEKSFLKNHGGSIPSNVLAISNTASSNKYQNYCKENNFEIHPARMPNKLVEFFINFLTDPGDIILDPFAGSNTTGYVAEKLKRKWISIEPQLEYIIGSKGWFEK